MSFLAKEAAIQQQQNSVQKLSIPVQFTQGAASTSVGLKSDLPAVLGIRCGDSTQNSISAVAESGENITDDSTDFVTASAANANAIVHFLLNLGDDNCFKIVSAHMTNRADGTFKGTCNMSYLSKGISNKGNIKIEFAEASLDLVDAGAAVYQYCLHLEYQVS